MCVEKQQELKSEITCCRSLRQSGCLVEVVVFMALMLDVMLMTTIDPILPAILKDIEENDGNSAVCKDVAEVLDDVTTTSGIPPDQITAFRTQCNDTKVKFRNSSVGLSEWQVALGNSTHLAITGRVGILVAAKPATEILSNLLVGCLVERFGHRFPMLVGIVFNTLATIGFAYTRSFLFLMITRICQAVGSSLSVVSGLALLASVYPDDERRSKANSRVFVGISVGIIRYPYGSAVYQFLGREAPFFILSGATILDGVLRLVVVAPSDPCPRDRRSRYELQALLRDRYIMAGLGCVLLQHFGLGVFLATGPSWMLDTLKAEQWQIGVVLAVAVIFHFMAQVITGCLGIRYGRWKFCMVGMVLFGTGMVVYPLCKNIWEVIGPEIIVRLGHGTVLCVISPLLCHLTDLRHKSQYGLVYGLYTAAYNMGLTLGPLGGGFLTGYIPFPWIYWSTGCVICLYAFVCIIFRNPRPKQSILVSCKDSEEAYHGCHDVYSSLPSI